jgi:hypothetical protein
MGGSVCKGIQPDAVRIIVEPHVFPMSDRKTAKDAGLRGLGEAIGFLEFIRKILAIKTAAVKVAAPVFGQGNGKTR